MLFENTLLVALVFLCSSFDAQVSASTLPPSSRLRSFYTRSHSLGDSYVFEPRDGWTTVNVTDLPYKYGRNSIERRSHKHSKDSKDSRQKGNHTGKSASGSKKNGTKAKGIPKLKAESILHPVTGDEAKFKPTGDAEDVTITWYTGQDLLNPSCWADAIWAPTDSSFVCALTLEGWKNKPQCFKFIERKLCNSPAKCIFVRVVDTCAGCAVGEKHVDLTKGAFTVLANPDEGRIHNIKMRPVLELPLLGTSWLPELWGPKN